MRFTPLLGFALSIAAAACSVDPGPVRGASIAGGPIVSSRSGAARVAADILLPPSMHLVAARVGPGATLASLLRANAVLAADADAIVAHAAGVFDLRKVRADQPYRLRADGQGAVQSFEYEVDADRVLKVHRDDPQGDFVAELVPIPKRRELTVVRGAIDRDRPSLFAAMEAAGETTDLSLALASIFGGEIDFNTELQPGDRFELLVEKQFRAGSAEPAGYGPIVAAEFDNEGRRLRAVRFTPQGGTPGYYDEHGVSMRRFFLKSPLKFDPIVTSAFSRSRFHPILGEFRAHLGVDYRAPVGAPVVAVSDGVVVEAGEAGGAGRMVHLRHANGYESEYLHLSSIAVRAGTRVRQGELIGRVGATGLATGPHLDYRLKKNGAFINPVTAHRAMPPAEPVPATQMTSFVAARDAALESLASPVPRVAASVLARAGQHQ